MHLRLFMFYAQYNDSEGLVQHFTDYFLMGEKAQRFFSMELVGKNHYFMPAYMRTHAGNSHGILTALDRLGWEDTGEGHVPEQVRAFLNKQDISSVDHSRWQVTEITEQDLIGLERFNLQDRESASAEGSVRKACRAAWDWLVQPKPFIQW